MNDKRYHDTTLPRRGQTRNFTVGTSQENFDLVAELTESAEQYVSIISDRTLYLQTSDTEADTIDETQQDATNTDQQVMPLPPWTRYDFVLKGDDQWLHVKADAAGSMYLWVSSQYPQSS